MTRGVLVVVWLVLFAPFAVAYEVRLSERRAGESLAGTVEGDGSTWSFNVRDRGGREIVLKEGSRTVAMLAADASGVTADVQLGAVRWKTGQDAPPATARAAIDLPSAVAVREVAIKLAELAPEPEYRDMRLTALELYAETARVQPESRPRGAAGRRMSAQRAEPAANEAVCETYTIDALLDCRDDEGNEFAVVPFLDDRLIERAPHLRQHSPDECYGACGASCGGKCVEVPVACPAAGSPPTSGKLCYAPHPEDGTQYKPSDDFDTADARCPPGTTVGGRVTVCTSASCCFQHDECNRHDRALSLGAYLKCQIWGLRACGFPAVYGVPKVPWTLKWFRASAEGTPIVVASPGLDVAGQCENGVWTPPEIVAHELEQAVCPIHGEKHTH